MNKDKNKLTIKHKKNLSMPDISSPNDNSNTINTNINQTESNEIIQNNSNFNQSNRITISSTNKKQANTIQKSNQYNLTNSIKKSKQPALSIYTQNNKQILLNSNQLSQNSLNKHSSKIKSNKKQLKLSNNTNELKEDSIYTIKNDNSEFKNDVFSSSLHNFKLKEELMLNKIQIDKLKHENQMINEKIFTLERIVRLKEEENEKIQVNYKEIIKEYQNEIEKMMKMSFCKKEKEYEIERIELNIYNHNYIQNNLIDKKNITYSRNNSYPQYLNSFQRKVKKSISELNIKDYHIEFNNIKKSLNYDSRKNSINNQTLNLESIKSGNSSFSPKNNIRTRNNIEEDVFKSLNNDNFMNIKEKNEITKSKSDLNPFYHSSINENEKFRVYSKFQSIGEEIGSSNYEYYSKNQNRRENHSDKLLNKLLNYNNKDRVHISSDKNTRCYSHNNPKQDNNLLTPLNKNRHFSSILFNNHNKNNKQMSCYYTTIKSLIRFLIRTLEIFIFPNNSNKNLNDKKNRSTTMAYGFGNTNNTNLNTNNINNNNLTNTSLIYNADASIDNYDNSYISGLGIEDKKQVVIDQIQSCLVYKIKTISKIIGVSFIKEINRVYSWTYINQSGLKNRDNKDTSISFINNSFIKGLQNGKNSYININSNTSNINNNYYNKHKEETNSSDSFSIITNDLDFNQSQSTSLQKSPKFQINRDRQNFLSFDNISLKNENNEINEEHFSKNIFESFTHQEGNDGNDGDEQKRHSGFYNYDSIINSPSKSNMKNNFIGKITPNQNYSFDNSFTSNNTQMKKNESNENVQFVDIQFKDEKEKDKNDNGLNCFSNEKPNQKMNFDISFDNK